MTTASLTSRSRRRRGEPRSTTRHLYPIRLDLDALDIDRDSFIDELTARNIGTSVHFIPLHTFTWYRERFGYAPEDFPVAWGEFQRLLSLPMNPSLSDADVADVIEAVSSVATAARR